MVEQSARLVQVSSAYIEPRSLVGLKAESSPGTPTTPSAANRTDYREARSQSRVRDQNTDHVNLLFLPLLYSSGKDLAVDPRFGPRTQGHKNSALLH